jgi:hypothetical protein
VSEANSRRAPPGRVAKAILKAATEGGRDARVGVMAVINTTVANLMPSLGDKMSAQRASSLQENIQPIHPKDMLYKPGITGSSDGCGTPDRSCAFTFPPRHGLLHVG